MYYQYGKKLGSAKDEYIYDVQDDLVGYRGYDGYSQTYMYSALGMMYEKTSVGNAERVVLESVVADGAALSKNEESSDSDEDDHQQTTSYTYDVLATFYQVLTETTGDSTTTYEYGIERIAAYTDITDAESVKTHYVYDVDGSVVQTVASKYTGSILGAALGALSVIPIAKVVSGKKLGALADAGDNIAFDCGTRTGCFVAGTLVLTPDGLVPIEEIEVGDTVIATDPEKQQKRMK